MNYDARVWVRPRTTTRVELIRGYTGHFQSEHIQLSKARKETKRCFKIWNLKHVNKNLKQRWLPANNTGRVARNLDPSGCFQAFLERSKEPVGRHFGFSTMEKSARTGELEKARFDYASEEVLKQLNCWSFCPRWHRESHGFNFSVSG